MSDSKHDNHPHEHPDKSDDDHGHEHEEGHKHSGIFGEKTEIIFSLICGALLLIGYLIGKLTGAPDSVSLVLYICA